MYVFELCLLKLKGVCVCVGAWDRILANPYCFYFIYLVSPQKQRPPIIPEASGVTNSMNASLVGPRPHTDRQEKKEREEVKYVPPLNPSRRSWQHQNLKRVPLFSGHKSSQGHMFSDWQRDKDGRVGRREEWVKELGRRRRIARVS